MHKFYPSQIAQLVLGYLSEVGCYESHKKFLFECPYLLDCRQLYEDGEEYNPTFGFDGPNTLVTILQEYGKLKAFAIHKNVKVSTVGAVGRNFGPRTPDKANTRSFAKSTANQRTRLAALIKSNCSPNKVPIPRSSPLFANSSTVINNAAAKSTLTTSAAVNSTHHVTTTSCPNTSTYSDIQKKTSTPNVLPEVSKSFIENGCQTDNNKVYKTNTSRNVTIQDSNVSTNANSQDSHETLLEQDSDFLDGVDCSPMGPAISLLCSSNSSTPLKNSTDHPVSPSCNIGNNLEPSSSNSQLQKFTEIYTGTPNKTPSKFHSKSPLVAFRKVGNYTSENLKTPSKSCPPPQYRRAPDTNSPRLILSHERSSVPSLTTPSLDFRDDVTGSPKRKSIVPRKRRIISELDSPLVKQTQNHDQLDSSNPSEEMQDPVVADIVGFLNRSPVAEKIAKSINIAKTNTPLKAAMIPESCDNSSQGYLIKEVLEQLQHHQIFENVLNGVGSDECDLDSNMFMSPYAKQSDNTNSQDSKFGDNSRNAENNERNISSQFINEVLNVRKVTNNQVQPDQVINVDHANDPEVILLTDEEPEKFTSDTNSFFEQNDFKPEQLDVPVSNEVTESGVVLTPEEAPESSADITSNQVPKSSDIVSNKVLESSDDVPSNKFQETCEVVANEVLESSEILASSENPSMSENQTIMYFIPNEGATNEGQMSYVVMSDGSTLPQQISLGEKQIVSMNPPAKMDPLQMAMQMHNIGEETTGYIEMSSWQRDMGQVIQLPVGQIPTVLTGPVLRRTAQCAILPNLHKRTNSFCQNADNPPKKKRCQPRKRPKINKEKNIFITSQQIGTGGTTIPPSTPTITENILLEQTKELSPKLQNSTPPKDKTAHLNNPISSTMKNLISYACEVVGARDSISPNNKHIRTLNFDSTVSQTKGDLPKISPNSKKTSVDLPVSVIELDCEDESIEASPTKLLPQNSPTKLILQNSPTKLLPQNSPTLFSEPVTEISQELSESQSLLADVFVSPVLGPQRKVYSKVKKNVAKTTVCKSFRPSGQMNNLKVTKVKNVPNLPAGIKLPSSWKKTQISSYADTVTNMLSTKESSNISKKSDR